MEEQKTQNNNFFVKISVSPKHSPPSKKSFYTIPKNPIRKPLIKITKMKANILNISAFPTLPDYPYQNPPKIHRKISLNLRFKKSVKIADKQINRAEREGLKQKISHALFGSNIHSRTLKLDNFYTDTRANINKTPSKFDFAKIDDRKNRFHPSIKNNIQNHKEEFNKTLCLPKPDLMDPLKNFNNFPQSCIKPYIKGFKGFQRFLPRKNRAKSQFESYLKQACESYHLQKIDKTIT